MKRSLAATVVGGVAVAGAAVAGPAAVAATLGNDVSDVPPEWRKLVECESGGNGDAVNPSSGAAGYYQIMPGTWRAHAPEGYPDHPTEASAAQQTTVAKRIRDRQGADAWVCGGVPSGSTQTQARTHSSDDDGDGAARSEGRVYTKVENGDTLSGTAQARQTSWTHLYRDMSQPFLSNPHRLEVGSKINVTNHP